MPTHYTLRHYSSWDTEALRYWRFEGSCDGETWTVIREHNNDATLKMRGQLATWRVRCTQHYSKFRIFQFDKNSNGHYYLALSGFEVYGSVVRQHKYFTWDQWPKNKSKHLQVDLSLVLICVCFVLISVFSFINIVCIFTFVFFFVFDAIRVRFVCFGLEYCLYK